MNADTRNTDPPAEEDPTLLIIKKVLLVAGILMLPVLIAMHNCHSSAGAKAQAEAETILKAMPLPPDSEVTRFYSGYELFRGSVVKDLVSTTNPREVCAFYVELMRDSEWPQTRNRCVADAGQEFSGRALLEFTRGNSAYKVHYRTYTHRPMSNLYEYSIVVNWDMIGVP